MASFEELLARTLARIRPVVPAYTVIIIATVAMLLILTLMTFRLDVSDRRYYLMSLFVELRAIDAFYLACAWFKLVTMITLLFSFQSLTVLHYVVFLVPGLLYCIQPQRAKKIPAFLGWLAAEFAGLLSTNLICGYYLEMSGRMQVLAIYIVLAVFMSAFGIYRFIYELEEVSDLRAIRRRNGRSREKK